jgi:flagellar hook-basal body complex protein FliE
MNDVSIRSNLTLPSITQDNAVGIKQESDSKTFGSILKDSISEVNQSASLHETMIAMEKASISFQTMLTVRNKALEAYQEIMRMQV